MQLLLVTTDLELLLASSAKKKKTILSVCNLRQ